MQLPPAGTQRSNKHRHVSIYGGYYCYCSDRPARTRPLPEGSSRALLSAARASVRGRALLLLAVGASIRALPIPHATSPHQKLMNG